MKKQRLLFTLGFWILYSTAWAAPQAATGDSEPTGADYFRDAKSYYSSGQYFKAARYVFSAIEMDPQLKREGYAWITVSLMKARLYNAASYFFIKTLQSDHREAIRRVLPETENIFVRAGADLFRKYLVQYTRYEDYDSRNRSAYLYSLGKEALLAGKEEQAIGYLNGISTRSPLWASALLLRATAAAVLGDSARALRDFRECQSRAGDGFSGIEQPRRGQLLREAQDLQARCIAGEARTLYQMNELDEADQTYDQIQKSSMVWPDILFEQAWNAFGRKEYNRALGRLVSYKSPALKFVFNSEVEVLRAQSYLALCLYSDANEVINEFNSKYAKVGEEVKSFTEGNSNQLPVFYEKGKEALRISIYTNNDFLRMLNRFVRGPYFVGLTQTERDIAHEQSLIQQLASQSGVGEYHPEKGFPGFLKQVLQWRKRTVQLLGGAYVKNSLIDYHQALIEDFKKMSFIKLEMLKYAKEQLMNKGAPLKTAERGRGEVSPSRRDYQYYWSFNGEFWNDELGDYVFGLESECGKSGG